MHYLHPHIRFHLGLMLILSLSLQGCAAESPKTETKVFDTIPVVLKLLTPRLMVYTGNPVTETLFTPAGQDTIGSLPPGIWLKFTLGGNFAMRRFEIQWNSEPVMVLKAVGCRLFGSTSPEGPWRVLSIDSQMTKRNESFGKDDEDEVVSALDEVEPGSLHSAHLFLVTPRIIKSLARAKPRKLIVMAKHLAELLKEQPLLEGLTVDCADTTQIVLPELIKLRHLELHSCTDLKDFSFLNSVKEIQTLSLEKADNIETLTSLPQFTNLRSLNISSSKLKNIAALSNFPLLISLGISGPVESIAALKKLPNLMSLNYSSHPTTQFINDVGELTQLKWLRLNSIEDTTHLSSLINLKELYISNSSKLENIDALSKLENLECLDIKSSYKLRNISSLKGLKKLKILDISFCTKIVDILSIRTLSELRLLSIVGNGGIPSDQVTFIKAELPKCFIDEGDKAKMKELDELMNEVLRRN